MYDENSFQNYIFWLKVKRVFMMALFSIIGAIIGIIINTFAFNIGDELKPLIIAGCTLLFFGISLLFTANVGRDVQEGYWKMAVLRKLTVISKKLDALDNLGNLENLENLENLRSLKNLDKASKLVDIVPDIATPIEPPVKKTRTTKASKTVAEPTQKTTRTRKTTTKKTAPPADEFEGFTVASDDPEQLFFQ